MFVDVPKQKFSLGKTEILNIFVAWIGITLAFSWRGFTNFSGMLTVLPIILVGTLTGFIVHELAHKYSAIKYGAFAEFRMWSTGLLMAVGLALLTGGGFVFAAPGAVYIYGRHITLKQNGIISLSGPLANLVLAIAFIISGILIPVVWYTQIAFSAAFINIFLGGFNMLPIPPLDGFKVFSWNKSIWIIVMAALVSLFLIMGGF